MEALKDGLKSIMRRFGYDVVRYAPSIETPVDVLALAVRYRLTCDERFFFVQIGAHDGVSHDPLRSLILKYHLRGLLVEPLPDVFVRLKANYASEPQLVFDNVAIAKESGEVSLFRFRPDAPVEDDLHAMATFDERRMRALARKRKLEDHVEEVRVPSVPFRELLARHDIQQITLLQVDVEGFDYEVLKMAFAAEVFPEMINFEYIHLSAEDRLAARRLLSENGYRLIDAYIDTFAMRDA